VLKLTIMPNSTTTTKKTNLTSILIDECYINYPNDRQPVRTSSIKLNRSHLLKIYNYITNPNNNIINLDHIVNENNTPDENKNNDV
jgi:hypothetical protein